MKTKENFLYDNQKDEYIIKLKEKKYWLLLWFLLLLLPLLLLIKFDKNVKFLTINSYTNKAL